MHHHRRSRSFASIGVVLAALAALLSLGPAPSVAQPQPQPSQPAPTADPVVAEIEQIAAQLDQPELESWYRLEYRMLELRHRPELQDMLVQAVARDDAVASRRARQLLALLSRPVDPALDSELPALVPNLFSSDPQRRMVACDMLWRHRSAAATRELISRMQDLREDRELRVHATLALAVQAATPQLINALDAATTLPDSRLAIAALNALDLVDRRSEEPPRAIRIARVWRRAAEIWRREHAWRLLARHLDVLDGADLLDNLLSFREDEPRVRAVMWRVLPLCTSTLPDTPGAQLDLLRAVARMIPREYHPASTALKSFIHHAAPPALLARLATDGELDDNVVAALPASAREAAAWFEPVAFERFVHHEVVALARSARGSIVRVGGGPALMTRLPAGPRVLGSPGESLRDLLRRLSRETGIDVVVAPNWPLLDSLALPGVMRGGSCYDVLATVGELYGLRFAFEGDRLVLHSAGASADGNWWPPRRAVPSALLDRFNLRVHNASNTCPTGDDGRPSLAQLISHCGAVLDAPVVCSLQLAQTIGLRTSLEPLPAGRPLATALPQSLESLGLKATFRGASLWIGSGDELAAWAAIERFRTRPEPDELGRLGQNPLLDARPVVAECLSLEDPPEDAGLRTAWVDAAIAELIREFARSGGHRDSRVAFMLRVLGPHVADPRVLDWLVKSLGVTDGRTRAAARETLARVNETMLWGDVAPRLPGLPPIAQRELADLLATSVTDDRFGQMLDTLLRNPSLHSADDRVLRLRALRGPLSRIALPLLPGRPMTNLPPAAPLAWQIDNASPTFFFYAMEVSTGQRVTPGQILRDWWTRLEPLSGADLGGTSVLDDWRLELPRALRDVGLGAGGHTPLPVQATWFPGVSEAELEQGATDLPAELMVEAPGARAELALFEALLHRVAMAAAVNEESVETVLAGRRSLSNFAFWLTAAPGVEIVIAAAARAESADKHHARIPGTDWLPDERVPSADRAVWQRVATWLQLLETRDPAPPNESIARLGIRIRQLAGLPLPDWYAGYRERATADPAWTNPVPQDEDDSSGDSSDPDAGGPH